MGNMTVASPKRFAFFKYLNIFGLQIYRTLNLYFALCFLIANRTFRLLITKYSAGLQIIIISQHIIFSYSIFNLVLDFFVSVCFEAFFSGNSDQMAATKDAHVVVEIPVDEEHQQKLISAMNIISSAIQHHPLMEISQSPGHLLLLKLWQREEHLFGRKIVMKETRLDMIKRELFQLCCFFFVFHGLFLTILFTSYNSEEDHGHHHSVCQRWWIPSLLSVCTSLVIVFLVQMKLFRYWKVINQLHREKNDNRALTRCIQELRMKGASFGLSKEPPIGKRMKSSSVEIKWKPLTWFSQFLITISLVCFTGLIFPTSRFILCG